MAWEYLPKHTQKKGKSQVDRPGKLVGKLPKISTTVRPSKVAKLPNSSPGTTGMHRQGKEDVELPPDLQKRKILSLKYTSSEPGPKQLFSKRRAKITPQSLKGTLDI